MIAAYLWGRPKWVMATAADVGDTAGRAGSAAGSRGQRWRASIAGRAPDLATSKTRSATTVRSSSNTASGLIVFVLVWIAIGLEVALLGAAPASSGSGLLLRAIEADPMRRGRGSGR